LCRLKSWQSLPEITRERQPRYDRMRYHLDAAAPFPYASTMPEAYNVLFLCTANSARSIMSEAILNRLGRGKFKAYSAGSLPNGKVNPHTIALLDRLGYETSSYRSKGWHEFSHAPVFDFVFTICDEIMGETLPVWPGRPISAHWGIADPAAIAGDAAIIAGAFLDAYAALARRIAFFASLPIARLDRMSLKHQLALIGNPERRFA
jgi:arsenate reductase